MLIAVYLTIIVNLLIIIHLNQQHSHYNRYNHPCEPNFHQEQCNLGLKTNSTQRIHN
jgi:hypothetical protein